MIKIALSSLLMATLATASTTMCFKKDHMDPSNIETISLDGGECKGMFSVKDMKKQGYDVDDIKISVGTNGMNYMYVFSKQRVVIGSTPGVTSSGAQVLTKEQLRGYLEELKEEEKLEIETKQRVANLAAGKDRYEQLCKECHGLKGEIAGSSSAKPLNTLTRDQFETAIIHYKNNLRKGSMVVLMKPYAEMLQEDEVINIYEYLQTLK